MKTIRYTRTLLYYDGTQVFLGHDLAGQPHVAVLVTRQDTGDTYIVVQVSRAFLELFLNGRVDLRRLLLARSIPTWYFARVTDELSPSVALEAQPGLLEDSALLPEPGLFIEESDHSFQEVSLTHAILKQPYLAVAQGGEWSAEHDLFEVSSDFPEEAETETLGLALAA